MFAAVEKTDEIIPVISYRKNGALAVISDQAVYGVGSDGGELWNYPLENTVDQAALGNIRCVQIADRKLPAVIRYIRGWRKLYGQHVCGSGKNG